ncbi:MAG: hypothetical protein V3T60_16870, partial [Candidatus Binatia bacterium]
MKSHVRSRRRARRKSLPARNKQTDGAVLLIHDEHLCIRSPTEAQVRTRSRLLALFAILLLDELEQRLCFAIVDEQNAADGRLSTTRQIVGVD